MQTANQPKTNRDSVERENNLQSVRIVMKMTTCWRIAISLTPKQLSSEQNFSFSCRKEEKKKLKNQFDWIIQRTIVVNCESARIQSRHFNVAVSLPTRQTIIYQSTIGIDLERDQSKRKAKKKKKTNKKMMNLFVIWNCDWKRSAR